MTAEILARQVNATRKPRGAGYSAACPVCGGVAEFWDAETGEGPHIEPRCGCPKPDVRQRWNLPELPARPRYVPTAASAPEMPDYGYVSRDLLTQAGCYVVGSREGADLVGRRVSGGRDYSGLVFPFFWPGDTTPREYRLRRNRPDLERKSDGRLIEKGKYLSPPGRGNLLFFHPATPADAVINIGLPAVITEGEKKALALWRYFADRGESRLVIGLTGVWNWRGVIGKETGDDGQRQDVRGVIPDIERILWSEREVAILFDANVNTKQDVRAARACLTRELQQRGAVVRWVTLPADLPAAINGVDDFLDAKGPDALTELIAEAEARPTGETSVIEMTDIGMLERLWQTYPGESVYVDLWERWGSWNGAYWDFADGQAELQRMTVSTSTACKSEDGHLDPEKFQRWISKYRNRDGIAALRQVAQNDHRYRRTPEEFDADPWLINCANGTLDIRTGELSAPNRADLITRRIATAWDEDAKAPMWSAFLDQIFQGNRALVDYLQQALGYSLTGDISEQCFFICHGTGANGKSTMLRLIARILGPYAKVSAASTFQAGLDSTGHSDDLASLKGAHLVIASESNEDVRLDEALIKRLTGEETVRCAFKHKSFFEYNPTFKIWMTVNHLPTIRGLDDGIWRRIHRLPFNYTIPKDQRDPAFEQKLYAELPGILAWCVRGLWDKLEHGFVVPAEINEAVEEYRSEMNIVGDFIDAKCDRGEGLEEFAGDLYRNYEGFCQKSAQKPVTTTTFGRKLREMGFVKKHSREGVVWAGIGLKPAHRY